MSGPVKRVGRVATDEEERALQEVMAHFEPVARIRRIEQGEDEPPRLSTVFAELLAIADGHPDLQRCAEAGCEGPAEGAIYCQQCAFIGPLWPHLSSRVLIEADDVEPTGPQHQRQHREG